MNKQSILIVIVALLVGVGGGFYGGMKYQQNKTLAGGQFGARNFQNLSTEQRQQMGQQGIFRDMTGGQTAGGVAAGKIISRDENSITVELRDGGSKIIFLPESASISKSATGTLEDLIVGLEVMVSGTANSDGTLTAKSINLTPNLPMRME